MEDEDERFFSRLSAAMSAFGLTPFSGSVAIGYLRAQLAKDAGAETCARVMAFLLNRLNRKHHLAHRSLVHPGQMGCPNILPGLRAQPIWGKGGPGSLLREAFPWVALFEDNVDIIRREFLALRGSSAFQPYRSPAPSFSSPSSSSPADAPPNASDSLGQLATDRGAWNVAYLHLHGLDFADNLALCPRTAALLAAVPRHYSHAFFSALAPGSHITPHFGPTNKKLRCHLPLIVPDIKAEPGPSVLTPAGTASTSIGSLGGEGGAAGMTGPAWLRVGDSTVTLEVGQCVLFDDSFLHEAGNESLSPRVVLVIDVWHPDLSDPEVRFLQFLNKGQMGAAARLAKLREQKGGAGDKEDFLSVIREARRGAADMASGLEGSIWPHTVVDD